MKRPTHPHKPFRKPAPAPGAPGKPTHWDNVSEWYDRLVGDEGSEYHQQVVLPGVLRMLQRKETGHGDVPLRILDLACGQGVLCRQLAQRRHSVVGVDAAAGLIDAAMKREAQERLGITYHVADATKLCEAGQNSEFRVKNSEFDAVTIVLAIQNITPLSPVWQGCRELLKPGGVLILVMMHPCFRVPKAADWHWDDATQTQSRLVKQYLTSAKVEIDLHPGQAAAGKATEKTLTFHRPLQAYVNTLGNAGLLIDHIEEWPSHKTSQEGPRKKEIDRARKEIPMFLAVRARRV